MSQKILKTASIVLLASSALILLITIGLHISLPNEIKVSESQAKPRTLPKHPFTQKREAYQAISNTLKLNFATPALQIPNLKSILVYYGTSDRPDIPKDQAELHFSLANGREQATINPGEKLFLFFNRNLSLPQYVFSPDNKPTPIWLEAESNNQEAIVRISMKNEEGDVVHEPFGNANFNLSQREYAKTPGSAPWEIGKWRVDGTLLARQRARWYGEDRFLEKHGGDEFAEFANKQRLDFGENGGGYSVYLSNGEYLIWKEGNWIKPQLGENTKDYPLMQVKRIDERIMSFDLWDQEGVTKVSLNLLKSKEPWSPQQIEQDFKFIATRTRSQYVFEVKDDRVILRPQDWLVLTESGWEKLDTEQEIDSYVDRKLIGPLFIFEGVVKKDDKQILIGTLFNSTRTESQSVELISPQSSTTVINIPKEELENKEPYGNRIEFHDYQNE